MNQPVLLAKPELTEKANVPATKSALVITACYETLEGISDKAKEIAIRHPDIYVGTFAGALACLFLPVQEYAALDALIAAYRSCYYPRFTFKRLFQKVLTGTHTTFRDLVERHYTAALHQELSNRGKQVHIGLVNLLTAQTEYFDITLLSYREALKIIVAAVQPAHHTPVQINGAYYVESSSVDRTPAVHAMSLGIGSMDVLIPRYRGAAPARPAWKPTGRRSILEVLFKAMREYQPEFQEYTVVTIADARQIDTRIYYLDDPDILGR